MSVALTGFREDQKTNETFSKLSVCLLMYESNKKLTKIITCTEALK